MDVEHTAPAAAPKKTKHPAPQRKTASQKAMELKERDVRVLIRSLQRWGDIRLRYDVIVSTLRALDGVAWRVLTPFGRRYTRRS